jgi:divalent metal cation (Fe/Co/Zn/Cd) transporter
MRILFFLFIGFSLLMSLIAYLFVSNGWPNHNLMPMVAGVCWLITLILFFFNEKKGLTICSKTLRNADA